MTMAIPREYDEPTPPRPKPMSKALAICCAKACGWKEIKPGRWTNTRGKTYLDGIFTDPLFWGPELRSRLQYLENLQKDTKDSCLVMCQMIQAIQAIKEGE